MVTRDDMAKVLTPVQLKHFDVYMTQFLPYFVGNQLHYPDDAVAKFMKIHKVCQK